MKALLVGADRDVARNSSPFLILSMLDEQGVRHSAVMFNDLPEDEKALLGKVYEFDLKITDKKPKVLAMRELPNENPKKYYRVTKLDVKQCLDEMLQKIDAEGERDGVVEKIARQVIKDPRVEGKFLSWPAAKSVHHAYEGGLVEHTFLMFSLAYKILQYDPSCHGLDKGVVLSAIMLHDVGKVLEYEWTVPGPATVTERGLLLGHIVLGDELVVRACMAASIPTMKDRIVQLRHCILSHHGRKEWGSPIVPSTREAILAHQIDMIQSRTQMALEAEESTEVGKTFQHRALETEILRWKRKP